MRCTRCDGLAVPQAVGRTPDGTLVFGWCLACLDEAGCVDVVAARGERSVRARRNRARVNPRPTVAGAAAAPVRRPTRAGPREPDERRRLVGAVALVLALWGFVLMMGGLVVRARPAPRPASPLGNGSPALLLAGGGAVAAVGLGLWVWVGGRSFLGSRIGLKVVQAGAFVAALVTLAAGILNRSPRNDPLVVALATGALAVSVTARWVELRRFRPGARVGRG